MRKETLLQSKKPQGKGGAPESLPLRLVSVHSYKGGVGKTTIALVTAANLARQGKKVCLVDLDLLAPGLSWFQGIKRKRDISDFLFARLDQDGKAAPEVTADEVCYKMDLPWADSNNKNLHMVPAWTDLDLGRRAQAYLLAEARSGLLEARVEYLLKTLQRHFQFDFFIIDAPPSLFGTSDSVRRLVEKHRGIALQIVTPTGPDIEGTRDMMMETLKPQPKIGNRRNPYFPVEGYRRGQLVAKPGHSTILVLNRSTWPVSAGNERNELANIVAKAIVQTKQEEESSAEYLSLAKTWLKDFYDVAVLSESVNLGSLVRVRREKTDPQPSMAGIVKIIGPLSDLILAAFNGELNNAPATR